MPVFLIYPLIDDDSSQLAIIYFSGTGTPNTAWHVMGLAMRLAMDKGAHRQKPSTGKPTIESEQMKRAFWFEARLF